MNHRESFRGDRLIIFGRYPLPGKTKTRLIPALGPAGAAYFQRHLTERIFRTVMEIVSDSSLELAFYFEGGDKKKMRRWIGDVPVYSRQSPGDLGERIQAAFREAFQDGCRRVILLGTDIPELTARYLREALDALKANDLVLGPSTDGGYGLIGLKKPHELFTGVHWSTDGVLAETLRLAEKKALKTQLLIPLRDIDTVETLREWNPEWEVNRPYLSVIIPVLNEEKIIKETIARARGADTEIIVVDGGSHDGTLAKARDSGARVEKSPRGRGRQQNRGAAAARGRVLLFLHADTKLPPGYVDDVFEVLMDPGTAFGAFHFETDLNHPFMKTVALMTNFRSHYLKLPYGDQGLFLRKGLFESIGGFPEVSIAEDLFLVRKLARCGSLRLAPSYVRTSARRWQRQGLLRTTLVNIVITAACYLGISHRTLLRLHNLPAKIRTYLKNRLTPEWLRCRTTQNTHILPCMLRFFVAQRLALERNSSF